MSGNGWVIEGAPRPVPGSPEDLAHRRLCVELRKAIDRTGESILPGSPQMEDEIQARIQFLQMVLPGFTVGEALAASRRRRTMV